MTDSSPNILVLIDWYLPGYKAGGPIQSISNLIQAMKDRYGFGVITTDTDHASEEPYPDVTSDQWIQRPEGTSVYYFSGKSLSYVKLAELLSEQQFDFLYLNSMYSLPFTMWPLWRHRQKTFKGRVVLAPRGMLQAGAVRIKWLKKRIYLSLMRLSGVQKQIIWHATDEQEAKDIQRFFGKNLDIRVAPNLPRQDQSPWQEVAKQAGEAHFVFSSRVSRKKNLEFFLDRLTGVKGKIIFDIYGPKEDEAYYQLCLQKVQQLPQNIQVRFMGAIPTPELQKTLMGYHFSVLTTHAENFGHAIFEGMLAGNPVLISDRTPWRDLTVHKAGWDLPLENPQKFEQLIQEIVDMDQATYNRWSESAWNYAKAFRTNPALLDQIQQVFS